MIRCTPPQLVPLWWRARVRRRPTISFFFFKQKTAYEIGLGIPAEPLFRSTLFPYTPTAISIFVCLSMVQLMAVFISMRCTLCGHFLQVALTLILVVGYAIAAS